MTRADISPKEFYTNGLSDRKPYEDRAQLVADLTLPYMIRRDGADGSAIMTDNNAQSYGARLVNTLRAKMGMALLPPSTSSFRFVANPEEMLALTQGNSSNVAKVNNLLSQSMIRVNDEIEVQQIRPQLFSMLAHMIVVGSCVVEKVEGKGVRLHPLKSFTASLDDQGHPVAICLKETILHEKMPPDITPKTVQDEYELHTLYRMEGEGSDKWVMTQELEGEIVGEEKTYKDYDEMPVRYFGWTWMPGDDYHRPYGEDYYKDLQQLDNLARLLTDGSIIAAKSLILVNERGGRTRKDAVALSDNGDVIDGHADDVTSFTLDKNYDFQVPMEREANLKRELASAFLLNESATRDAERVTAAEVRFMAQELESSTLAGIYSTLALDWSKWIVERIMDELKIKFETIEVNVLTGLDALGRSQESQKLDAYLQRMQALDMLDYINQENVAQRYADFEGIDTQGLLKTQDEVAAQRQKQQDQAIAAQGQAAAAEEGGREGARAAAQQASQGPQQPASATQG